MRVREIQVASYGLLSGRSFENLPGGIVIMLGRNEAGKSTLFSLLSTLLYGFYPVKDFPYRSWNADACPEFKSELLLEGGGSVQVSRKLMSSPAGTMNWNDSVVDLGNRNLPFAAHVGRDLYNAVYALTQATLRSLNDAQRGEIEDRLLLGLSSESLRPAREAVQNLREQADALWRSNRRGNQRYRLLERDRQAARKQRGEARMADEAVRGKAARLDEMGRHIEALLQEKAELSAGLRRADELLPVKNRLGQIARWSAEIKNPEAVRNLPEGLSAVHGRLALSLEEARENLDGLKAERNHLDEKRNMFSPGDKAMLARAGEIDSWVRKIAAHEKEKFSLDELEREAERLEAAIGEAAGALFSGPWNEALLDEVDSVVLPDLKARIMAFQDKRREADAREAEAMAPAEVYAGKALPVWGAAAAAAAGIALLLSGFLISSEIMVAFAVFLVLLSAYSFHLRSQQSLLRERRKSDTARLAGLRRLAGGECDAARRAVADALHGLPVAMALIENPDLSLYQGVEKLHSLSAEYRKLRAQGLVQQEKWRLGQKGLEDLLCGLGLERASAGGLGQAERRLAAAREHERLRDEAAERLRQIAAVLPAAELKLNRAGEAANRFRDSLREAAGGDFPERELMEKAVNLQRLDARIRNAREELEREYPGLSELEAEIEHIESEGGNAWSFDPVEIEKRRGRLQDIQRELGDLREEKGRLETEINSARGQVSVGEIDGEIARIEEEMEETARRRDRLMLLACLLREADRRFREKHQPDVLKRAGEYLRAVTGGLYKTITTMDSGDGADRLVVISGNGGIHPVEFPLSGGTLDQIFLAFRLAVIDHLDDGREALPMLLDEALVNWDAGRLQRFDGILRQASGRRQIFFFTCHEWMAGRIAGVTGSPVFEL